MLDSRDHDHDHFVAVDQSRDMTFDGDCLGIDRQVGIHVIVEHFVFVILQHRMMLLVNLGLLHLLHLLQ